jgi:mannose-6-phosphate isomerase-like protein (cupin superfamily)
MRIYRRSGRYSYCGFWNGSPIEVSVPEREYSLPEEQKPHHHPYHEYYINLDGYGELEVEGEIIPLTPGMVVMVEPGEKHRVVSVCPERGGRWVVVKERSEPDSKFVDE